MQYLLILLFGVISMGCTDSTPQVEVNNIRPVNIIVIKENDIIQEREFHGIVEASKAASISFRVPGVIVNFPAEDLVGKIIKKGDLLAKLDPQDFEIALQAANAQHDLSKAKYNRAKALLLDKYISQMEYDGITSRYQMNLANVAKAKANLSYTEIRAPFDASISAVKSKNHQAVAANTPIVHIQNEKHINISMQLSDAFVSAIPSEQVQLYQQGNHEFIGIKVSFQTNPDKFYAAYLREAQLFTDQASASYRAVVSLPNPDGLHILPGMTAKVYIDLNDLAPQKSFPIVPLSSVFNAQDNPVLDKVKQVWKVNKETMTVSLHDVKLGNLTPQGIEIIEGVNIGDKIVTSGVHFLESGTVVSINERERGL